MITRDRVGVTAWEIEGVVVWERLRRGLIALRIGCLD